MCGLPHLHGSGYNNKKMVKFEKKRDAVCIDALTLLYCFTYLWSNNFISRNFKFCSSSSLPQCYIQSARTYTYYINCLPDFNQNGISVDVFNRSMDKIYSNKNNNIGHANAWQNKIKFKLLTNAYTYKIQTIKLNE